MALNCVPVELAEAARCLCFTPEQREQVRVYLLAFIAGLQDLPPRELAARAACYCYDKQTLKQVQTYLLCQIANSGTGSGDAVGEEGGSLAIGVET